MYLDTGRKSCTGRRVDTWKEYVVRPGHQVRKMITSNEEIETHECLDIYIYNAFS
jgi:hypothetical protein